MKLRVFSSILACTGLGVALLYVTRKPFEVKAAPPPQEGRIDGSKTPHLIPDEFAYRAVMMLATAASGDVEVEHKRAAAFIATLPLSAEDNAKFVSIAKDFNSAHLARSSGQSHDNSEFTRKFELSRQYINILDTNLSAAGRSTLRVVIQNFKKQLILFPLPTMPHKVAVNIFDRIFDKVLHTVHAQGMTPSGSYYTWTWGDNVVYASAYTDASGCNCHTVTANMHVYLPNGKSAHAYSNPPAGVEYTVATATLNMSDSDFVEGTVIQSSNHTAYCPVIGSTFLQQGTYTAGPLTNIHAYYFCDSTRPPCGGSNSELVVYTRCNAGTTCHNLITKMNPKPNYALIRVSEINIGLAKICVAWTGPDAVQPTPACGSPDPRP